MQLPGKGPSPNTLMFLGDVQGQEGKGKAEIEQVSHLRGHGFNFYDYYRTNIVKIEGTELKKLTPDDIDTWHTILEGEITIVDPDIIVPMGLYATRWLLGDSADLDAVHGIPINASDYAPDMAHRHQGKTVFPIYHPSFGGVSNDGLQQVINDHAALCAFIDFRDGLGVTHSQSAEFKSDVWLGNETYIDVTGAELEDMLMSVNPTILGLDTEGTPDDPWSLQVSWEEGMGVVLRYTQEDFSVGIDALTSLVKRNCLYVMHNAMYDVEMSLVMGLDLTRANIWDTMYAAYLLRIEPQGLKALAYRWLGMRMSNYLDVVGDAGRDRQLSYLGAVWNSDVPKPETQVITQNNGVSKIYNPQPLQKTAMRIMGDVVKDKRNKDGEPVNVYERWHNNSIERRQPFDELLGPMPFGSLADIPLDKAVVYSCRDADAAIRLYAPMRNKLESMGMTRLMSDGMEVLSWLEEMQRNGMPASREYFNNFYSELTTRMHELQTELSCGWFNKKPINPGSPPDTIKLLNALGLKGELKTSTGAMSTSKDSIEHLRYDNEAVEVLLTWREHQHIRDAFCYNVLQRIPVGTDIAPVRCNIKNTRTPTRRLASSDPNLLAIPARTKLGLRVRHGYRCPDGQLFGSWDLSQIEARGLAHLANDQKLCGLIREGMDIHTATAQFVFGVEEPTKEQRDAAKTINFGIIYGITGKGLNVQFRRQNLTQWTDDQCDNMINKWYQNYWETYQYTRKCASELAATGIVRDHWDMLRYLPGVWSRRASVVAEAERMAVSHRVQGLAQGMIQNSMRWLRPRIHEMQDAGMNIHLVLQVHDELVFRFDEHLGDEVGKLVLEALTQHSGIDLAVPVLADGGVAQTWGGLK